MATDGKFWSKKTPADMHGDGVHFSKQQLADKEAKRFQKEQEEKKKKKKASDIDEESNPK